MPNFTQLPDVGSSHQLDSEPPPPALPACRPTSRMTRGRKKDLTIPPTRALVQQRDYRARRAQYVVDLEERCRKAEEENLQLRSDLAAARAGQVIPPIVPNPQTAHASSELMHNLSIASASLARFQQLAFSDAQLASQSGGQSPGPSNNHPFSQRPSTSTNVLRPASFPSPTSFTSPGSFPSPAPSPPYAYASAPYPASSSIRGSNPPRRKRLYREDSPDSVVSPAEDSFSRRSSRSPSPLSECCGGIMDCTDLIERDDGSLSDDDSPASRTSRVRTTSTSVPTVRYNTHRY
ncbi:hypothetical protein Hypma_008034 [Hypsizygus marmoreus]|uniref:BZIP domain-containing protein n=1 Tax=Hypsizygus marmoreus TaxID=39966 RepID=A0A369JZW6_HYPMA|nr:hypothetical protein Hypma_008034 [Hypsizygus marmoreus]